MPLFEIHNLVLGFEGKTIIDNLSLTIEPGTVLSIVGPNGSGKSTLLKGLSRSLKPMAGTICLNGRNLASYKLSSLARHVAVLHQSPLSPRDLTVRDLVEHGRFPYQRWWKRNANEDKEAVEWAIHRTGLDSLADRLVGTLSGGERQRAWIAMALAQKPEVLLLDEPTTFLDICHQLEIMDLVENLNKELGMTVMMVLHDMNHAARYSDSIAVLRQGKLFAFGNPAEVVTAKMLREVFGVDADIWLDEAGRPVCLARRRAVGL